MDPGPPHVRSRSYCSVERERERESATPSADPHAHPPLSTTSFSQSSQTQAEGVGCLDTAGGQAMGSAKQAILWLCPDGRIIHYLTLLLGYPASMTCF